MSDYSKIEWTDATWNPTRGCSKVSPGCEHCYARAFAERWRGIKGHPFEYGFDLKLVPHKLIEPIKWIKPRHIFVDSMSDLFHESIPDIYIQAVFDIIKLSNWHEFQICTKRSLRMHDFILNNNSLNLDNIWLGVSVENRKHGLLRIDHLRELSSRIKFLSIEPLLEDLCEIDLTAIDWVILGGETGPGARVMKKDWVFSIIDQCRKYKIPFFFQQWGAKNRSRKDCFINGKIIRLKPKIKILKIPQNKHRHLKLEKARKIVSKLDEIIKLKYNNLKLDKK